MTISERDAKINANVERLKQEYPHIEIVEERGYKKIRHYVPCYKRDRIEFLTRHTPVTTVYPGWPASAFLTRDQAKEKIEQVLPKAREKFEGIVAAINQLREDRGGFDIDYTYDGDTHGIYEAYQYVSFNMEGIEFRFTLGDVIGF